MDIDPADAAPFGTMPFYKLRQVFNLLNHEAVGIVVHTDDRSRSLRGRAAKEIPQFDPRDAVGATCFSWNEIVASGGLISRLRESFCFDMRHFEMKLSSFLSTHWRGFGMPDLSRVFSDRAVARETV